MNPKALFFVLFGYLSGSVLYGYLLPKLLLHIDVTEQSGDHNPGVANAFTYGSIPVGILTLLLELAKGFVPVFLARFFVLTDNWWFALILVAPVVGHAFPLFRLKQGGKAIAVSFGVMLGLLPQFIPLALLVIFYLLFSLLRIKPHALRSILAFGCFGISCVFLVTPPPVLCGVVAVAAIVIDRHIHSLRIEKVSQNKKEEQTAEAVAR